MKPTKNKVFCKDCGRHKMLFETERKAETFIRFNSEEIETGSGRSPNRSYYCMFCNGWHVTSKKEQLNFKSKTEIVMEKYHNYKGIEELERETIKDNRPKDKPKDKPKENKGLRDKSFKMIERHIKMVENTKTSNNKSDIDHCVDILNAAYVELENAKNHTESKKWIKKTENRLNRLKEEVDGKMKTT